MEDLTPLQQAVFDFIKEWPKLYEGRDVCEAMRFRIDAAVINLVDRGLVQVDLNWKLGVTDKKAERGKDGK